MYVIVYSVLIWITFSKRLAFNSKAYILLTLITILGITMLYQSGLEGAGTSFLLVLPIAAIIMLEWNFGLVTFAISAISMLVFAFFSTDRLEWVLAMTIMALLSTGMVYAIKVIVPNDGSLKIGMPGEVFFIEK